MKLLADVGEKGFEGGVKVQLWSVSCEEYVEILEDPRFLGKQNGLRVVRAGQCTDHLVNLVDFTKNKGNCWVSDFTFCLGVRSRQGE